MNHSVAEIKAVAEAALLARQAADTAKANLEADPENQELKTAYENAETAASEAKAKADALSQEPDPLEKKKEKLLKKKGYIDKELKDLGVDDGDDDDEDDDEDSRPLTIGDLKRMDALKTRESVDQMIAGITDMADRDAVREALKSIVPSNDPAGDFRKAVGIANIDRNSKLLQEYARRPAGNGTATKTGAAPHKEEEFVPTAEEMKYMKSFHLTKEDILKARAAQVKE